MKKTLLIVAASTLSFGISSVVSAGGIEKAERYSAPLEQNIVEMDVSAVEGNVDAFVQTELELGLGLGSNAEVQELSEHIPQGPSSGGREENKKSVNKYQRYWWRYWLIRYFNRH